MYQYNGGSAQTSKKLVGEPGPIIPDRTSECAAAFARGVVIQDCSGKTMLAIVTRGRSCPSGST